MDPSLLGFRIQDMGGRSIRFVIPTRRTWEAVVVLSAALIAWLGCEIVVGAVLWSLATGRTQNPGGAGGLLFLSAWLMFWTYGGLMVAYQWCWLFAGIEVVELGRGVLRLQRVIPGLTRSRDYPLDHIDDLHHLDSGLLRFTWEGEWVEFAESLDALSAHVLLEEIAVRHPHLLADRFYDGYQAGPA